MYCPKCGQQQVLDEILFCSKCGLALSTISEVMEDPQSGNVPQSISEVKRSALIGFGLVTLSAVFLLATLIIGTPEPSFIVQLNLLVAVVVYLFALGYVMYKFLPSKKAAHTKGQTQQVLVERTPTTQQLLKDQDLTDSVPASDFVNPRRPRQPVESSVTEDTTSLLDKT